MTIIQEQPMAGRWVIEYFPNAEVKKQVIIVPTLESATKWLERTMPYGVIDNVTEDSFSYTEDLSDRGAVVSCYS